MGAKEGSIIAGIIAVHMPRNDTPTPAHVRPHMRVHAVDIDQSPGIGISPIADMDQQQTIVSVELAAKSSAAMAKNARPEPIRRDISCFSRVPAPTFDPLRPVEDARRSC
jgi:hypothetical protein